MNLNNIGTIGNNGFYQSRNAISFYQNDYLMHYNCIIASASTILTEIKATDCIGNGFYYRMHDQVEKRRTDLKEFYDAGGTMLLIIDAIPTWDFHNWLVGFKQVNIMDMLSLSNLPFQYLPQNGTGVLMANALTPLLSQAQINFTTLLQGETTQALIATQKTQIPVSYHQKIGNGLFMALPCITTNEGVDQEVFMQGLLEVCEGLKQEGNVEV